MIGNLNTEYFMALKSDNKKCSLVMFIFIFKESLFFDIDIEILKLRQYYVWDLLQNDMGVGSEWGHR